MPLFRILLSVVLIWVLLRQVSLEDFVTYWDRMLQHWPYLLVAMSAPGFALVITAARLQVLLKAQLINVSIFQVYVMSLVASVYNQIMPSTIGGDVVRGLWISKQQKAAEGRSASDNPHTASFSIIVLDRALGLMGILFAGLVAVLTKPSILQQYPAVIVILPLSFAGLFGILLLTKVPMRSIGRRIFSLGPLTAVRNKAITIYRTLRLYGEQKKTLLMGFLLSVALQGIIIWHFWFLSGVLGLGMPLHVMAAIVPVVTILGMLPISINGIGVTESALYLLAAPFGMTISGAVAVAWLFLISKLLWAVFGAIVNMRFRLH
jgi:uncharacterized protein (TIRG00374 family)